MSKTETKEELINKLIQYSEIPGYPVAAEEMRKYYKKILKPHLILLVEWAENNNKRGSDVRVKGIDISDIKSTEEREMWATNLKSKTKTKTKRPSSSNTDGGNAAIIISVLIVLFFLFVIVKCTHDAYNKPYYEPGVPYGNTAVENVKKSLQREGYKY